MTHYGLSAIVTQRFLSHYLSYLLTKQSVEAAYEFVEAVYTSNESLFQSHQQDRGGGSTDSTSTSILETMISFYHNGRAVSSLPRVCSMEEMGPHAIHPHDLTRRDVLYSSGLYICDHCQGHGCGWGYCCSVCQEDFHPLCAFGRKTTEAGTGGGVDEQGA
jgi:hypothetical protein